MTDKFVVYYNPTLSWIDTAIGPKIIKLGVLAALLIICGLTIDPALKGYSFVKAEWWIHMLPVGAWVLLVALIESPLSAKVFKPTEVFAELNDGLLTIHYNGEHHFKRKAIKNITITLTTYGYKSIVIEDDDNGRFELKHLSGRIDIGTAIKALAGDKVEIIRP